MGWLQISKRFSAVVQTVGTNKGLSKSQKNTKQIGDKQMIVQIVKFETSLSKDELVAVAESRTDQYRATPGLIEKFYCQCAEPNHYAGVLIWDSMESIQAFSGTELAKTIPTAYKMIGQPNIEVMNSMFELRDVMSVAA
jgi:heme-degrading monooxygenase HmoA